MKDFTKYIPGFRSDVKWKKIIAIIYYIMALLMLVGDIGVGLLFLVAPFFVFSLADLILRKRKGLSLQRTIIPLALSLVLTITACAIIEPATTNSAEDESAGDTHVGDKAGEEEHEQEIKDDEQELVQSKDDEQEVAQSEEEAKGEEERQPDEENLKAEEDKRPKEEEHKTEVEGELKVHFLDVGQADSALIQVGNKFMLIDAGDRGYGDGIVSYLKNQGVKSLEYLILTHPHADHIGGAVEVINAFDIGEIIMPKVSHNTKTFENLLIAAQDKGLKMASPNPGEEYKLGEAGCTILAPNGSSYKSLNDYSVVNKVTFGKTSFIFTGDAEDISENQMISNDLDLRADVLKVGHHGSDTSTTSSFLKSVDPKFAVISCGRGNKYGHPTQNVLDRLQEQNIDIYRTDEDRTIVATSDGVDITFSKGGDSINKASSSSQGSSTKPKENNQKEKPKKEEPKSPETDNIEEVYITDTGSKYHNAGCRHLKDSKIPISIKKAKSDGYGPCGVCNPKGDISKEEQKKDKQEETKKEDPKTDDKKTVYTVGKGTKYHRKTCRYVKENKTSISLKEAKSAGYEPCKVCKPSS